MKPIAHVTIYVMLAVAVFSFEAVGQVKSMTEAEYKSAIKAANSKSEGFDRRVTTTTEFFESGKKTGTEMFVEEFQSPDKVRTVLTQRKGKTVVKREIIEIDDARYVRAGSEMWAKWKRIKGPVYRLKGEIPPDDPKEQITHSYREARFNGQVVKILSRLSNKAYGFLIGAEINEIWINKSNQILKTVLITSEDSADNVVEKAVAIYDYAPNGLRIVAPIK